MHAGSFIIVKAAANTKPKAEKAPRRSYGPRGKTPSVSIRIRKPQHEKLREISQRRGILIPELLERIIDAFYRREKELPELVKTGIDEVDIISSDRPPRGTLPSAAPEGDVK